MVEQTNPSGWSAIRPILATPLGVVTGLWAVVWVLRHLGLVVFPELPIWIVAFLVGAYATFVLTFVAGRRAAGAVARVAQVAVAPSGMPVGIRQLVGFFAIVGAAGAAARGIDFLFLRGLDFSAGISAARLSNMALVEAAGAGARPLAAIGKLLMGCSTVAMVAAYLRYELISRRLVWAAAVSWILLLGFSVLEGGRNTIVVNVVLVLSAGLIRLRQDRPLLPFGRTTRFLIKGAAVVVVAFALYVFVDRFAALGYTDATVIAGIESAYSVKVSPWVEALPAGPARQGVIAVVMVVIYLCHGVDQLADVLTWGAHNQLAWGKYNFDLFVLFLNRAGLPIERFGFGELPKPGLYYTALGEFSIDFGPLGALVMVAIAGISGGLVWGMTVCRPSLVSELLLSFLIGWLVASPLYSIVSGFLGVLLAVAVFYAGVWLLRWVNR